MNLEDSRNALFVEPNAYIQKFESTNINKPKKVVFQEPYESMPPYYLNNNFTKGDCGCLPKIKENKNKQNQEFDFKNLMSLVSMFTKNLNINDMVSMFTNGKDGGLNIQNLLSSVLSNKGMLGNVLNLFGGKKIIKDKLSKKEIIATDYEIKNYTKVE